MGSMKNKQILSKACLFIFAVVLGSMFEYLSTFCDQFHISLVTQVGYSEAATMDATVWRMAVWFEDYYWIVL